MKLTRRELLSSLAVAPLAVAHPVRENALVPRIEIWHEPHCLSHESADGFRLLLNNEQSAGVVGSQPSSVIIAPGVRHMSDARWRELRRRVVAGTWLILESGVCFSSLEESKRQAAILESAFDLEVLPPIRVSTIERNKSAYIQYAWPRRSLTRTFEAVTPIRCEPNETIAWFDNRPVCARKTLGKGGVIYLGAMLGPALFAEEREAREIGSAIISFISQK